MQKGALLRDKGTPTALALPKNDGTMKPLEEPGAGVGWSTGEYLITDRSGKGIQKFSADGKPLGRFAAETPDRLAINDLDQVAALDAETKTIKVFDRDGKLVRTIARGPGYELVKPVDLAFDALGYLYVLERLSAVLVFSPTGALVSRVVIPEKDAGAFKQGAALALDSADRLYIYDDHEQRIQVYR